MAEWYRWGKPLAEQNGEYLTYKHYCERCKEEGIEPVGAARFRALMTARGLVIAPQDEDPHIKRFTRNATKEALARGQKQELKASDDVRR